jgi:hypothetical protein
MSAEQRRELAGVIPGGRRNLFCREWLVVRAELHVFPFAMDDAFANLRSGFAFAGLLVGIKIFRHTDVAVRAVFAGKTIKQAAMSLALVAVAVAGLLIEKFFDVRSDAISVLHDVIRKQLRVKSIGKRSPWNLGVKGRHRFFAGKWRQRCAGQTLAPRIAGRAGSGVLWQRYQRDDEARKHQGHDNFPGCSHHLLRGNLIGPNTQTSELLKL